MSKDGASVCQPNALLQSRLLVRRKTSTVVFYFEDELLLLSLGSKSDTPVGFGCCNAVMNGILQQRLPQERWHLGIQCCRLHFQPEVQRIPETHTLDLEIRLQRLDFLPDRHHLRPGIFKGNPQKIA